MKTVNILGTEYTIIEEAFENRDSDGYCDYSSKEIHIRCDNVNDLGEFEKHTNKTIRHEVIHAYMAESGLQANWQHIECYGHDETTIDWFAIQFPKILKTYKELECI